MLRGEGIPGHQLDDVPAFAGEQLNCRAVCRLAGGVGDVQADPVSLGWHLVFHYEQPLLLCVGIVLHDKKIVAAIDIDVRGHDSTSIKLKGRPEQKRDVVEAGVLFVQKQVVVFETIPRII